VDHSNKKCGKEFLEIQYSEQHFLVPVNDYFRWCEKGCKELSSLRIAVGGSYYAIMKGLE